MESTVNFFRYCFDYLRRHFHAQKIISYYIREDFQLRNRYCLENSLKKKKIEKQILAFNNYYLSENIQITKKNSTPLYKDSLFWRTSKLAKIMCFRKKMKELKTFCAGINMQRTADKSLFFIIVATVMRDFLFLII